jgi:hypothetical protein
VLHLGELAPAGRHRETHFVAQTAKGKDRVGAAGFVLIVPGLAYVGCGDVAMWRRGENDP